MTLVSQTPTGSPGIHAGRGLKLVFCDRHDATYWIARHSCRAWIETTQERGWRDAVDGSPGIHAGRGLKHRQIWIDANGTMDRPAFMPGVD